MTDHVSVSRAALMAALVCATPAVAQQAPPSAGPATSGPSAPSGADAPDVVVTGTRIRRPNVASAAPITTVTEQSLQAQAPLNVEEVLNRLPQVAPDNQQTYQDSDGRQRIKLRNLGFERTLVLIDGKRLGTQNGQDTNIIPVALLERVDVLTGGASAVYGSDAVAGVVNFILKPDFKGVQLDANYNFFAHRNAANVVTRTAAANGFPTGTGETADGGRADLTLTAGTALFEDRLKISGFVDYKQVDPILYSDRSTSACQLVQAVKDGPLSCSQSTYTKLGYIVPKSGASSGTALVNNPDGTRSFLPYGSGLGYAANPFDDYSFQRPDQRWNAGGFATLRLSEGATLYGSAIWFRDKSFNSSAPRVFAAANYGDDPYRVNCNNPLLSAAQASTICGTAAGTTLLAPIDLRYRFTGVPDLIDRYVNRGLRATGGVRGTFAGGWTYDLGGVYARNRQDFLPASLPSFDRINRSLDVVGVNGTPTCAAVVDGSDAACVPFDAFRAGNSSKALLSYIYTGDQEAQRTVGTLYDAQLNITGDLGRYGITSPLAKDGVAVALGGEFRKDTLVSTANAAFRNDYGGSDSDLQQHVWEGNVELQAPLVQERRFAHLLQWNGGLRVSKYDSNPDRFTTWKTEGLYAPVPDITVRASFNKAQRAPTVIESNQATSINFTRQGGSQNDFCAPVPHQIADPSNPGRTITVATPIASRDVCRATGLADSLYGSASLLCPNDQCTVRSGGYTVDPETAYTLTYGVLLKPRFLRGLVLSVDHYAIKIDNAISYNDDSYAYDGCLRTANPFFCSSFVRDANGTLFAAAAGNPARGFIREGTRNYYHSMARGYDIQAQYSVRLGDKIGRLDMDFDGSLTTFAGGQASPIQPIQNCAGYYGNMCGQLIPRWMHTMRTTYATTDGVFSASFNWRYVGALTSANNSGDPAIGGTPDAAQATFARFAPVSFFDLALTVAIAKRFTLRLIANNLLDRQAPIIPNSYNISLARSNTLPQRYDSLGRNVAISTSIRF